MSRILRFLTVCALTLSVAGQARSAVLPFTGTLNVTMGSFAPIVVTGSGVGTSNGVGAAASIPAGIFAVSATAAITPAIMGLVGGFAVCGSGLANGTSLSIPATGLGSCAPHPAGLSNALSFTGTTGTGGISASAYLTGVASGGTATTAAEIPLTVVGVGGSSTFSAFGLLTGTVTGNKWGLGTVTASGALNGVTTTLTASGFDNRNASGAGTLQLVTVTNTNLGLAGSMPSISVLTLTFVPEPGTLLLMGAGIGGLALSGRRRAK